MAAETSIYLAWQQALQANATLTAFIPSDNILIGPRKGDAPIPSICITTVGGSKTTEKVQGSKITGEGYVATPVFQFEVAIEGGLPTMLEIADAIFCIATSDNAILNAVGIQNVTEVGLMEYYDERSLLCRALRYSFSYKFKR